MKEFNLEKAKAGAPVCTRSGLDVRIICYDRKGTNYPIIALITYPDGIEYYNSYTINGNLYASEDSSDLNLMMKSVKHEGWINVYNCGDERIEPTHMPSAYVYSSKEQALTKIVNDDTYKNTIRIEWEE